MYIILLYNKINITSKWLKFTNNDEGEVILQLDLLCKNILIESHKLIWSNFFKKKWNNSEILFCSADLQRETEKEVREYE